MGTHTMFFDMKKAPCYQKKKRKKEKEKRLYAKKDWELLFLVMMALRLWHDLNHLLWE